jgi:hypothetical protein
MRAPHRRAGAGLLAALAALAMGAAGCGSGSSTLGPPAGGTGGTTTTTSGTGTTTTSSSPGSATSTTAVAGGGGAPLVQVTVLSHDGPYGGGDTAVAATSLAGVRSRSHCGSAATCWPNAVVNGSQLLIATTVEACRPVVSAIGRLRETTLQVDIVHQPGNSPDTACTGTVPRLWLFAVPLSSLPHHVTLTIEVTGGQSVGMSSATTTVALA